uniref:Uncharacterized protein n=1 Tax=Gopherus evgoodei TaxID=1825980 RepID=A0A8C5EWH0_9SAUR
MAGVGSAAGRLLQPCSRRGSAVGPGGSAGRPGGGDTRGADTLLLGGAGPACLVRPLPGGRSHRSPRPERGCGERVSRAGRRSPCCGAGAAKPWSGWAGSYRRDPERGSAAELGAQEVPQKHLAPLGKEREATEEERQSEELLKQTAAERQKIVWEWQELRGFLEEQKQRLLSRLEELERAIVQRRDEGVCSLSWEISLLNERGGEKGQQPLSQPLQDAGSTGGSWEDRMFRKPESSFAELEKRLSDFSLKSAMLQEVLLGFKEMLRRGLGSNTAIPMMINFWETSSTELFEGVALESKGTEAVACGKQGKFHY